MSTSEPSPIRIAIAGASGRMGKALVETVTNHPGCTLVAAFDQAHSKALGRDAGESFGQHTGVKISHDAAAAIAQAEVLIDFTRPESTLKHLALCAQYGVKAVVGTTGFDSLQKQTLNDLAKRMALVFSPNMAVGVNATFKLLEVAARILSSGYDIEVIEAHHNKKIDAPSGTALRMGEVIAQSLNVSLNEVGVFSREGITGERKPGSIGFSTIRGGDIVGDHTVLFAGIGERIEITHKSSSRMTYAQGSIRAAHYLMNKTHGLFDMQDVLGLNQLSL